MSSLQEVFSSSFFAQSNLHVFATIALPTSNSTPKALIGTQKLWSICIFICIQARIFICSCFCIGQELAFVGGRAQFP